MTKARQPEDRSKSHGSWDRQLKRVTLIAASLLVAVLLAPSAATADIGFVEGYGTASDFRPGAHPTITIGARFTYGGDTTEDLKAFAIDTPTGGVGNPNAISYDQKCPQSVFESAECPDSSQIGTV